MGAKPALFRAAEGAGVGPGNEKNGGMGGPVRKSEKRVYNLFKKAY